MNWKTLLLGTPLVTRRYLDALMKLNAAGPKPDAQRLADGSVGASAAIDGPADSGER